MNIRELLEAYKLIEGIQFSFPISKDTNTDFLIRDAYSLSHKFETVAKSIPGGKEFLDKIQDRGPIFVDDWSSPQTRDSGLTAINFYLNYKADESDKPVLRKVLNSIEDTALKLGFKLGEFKYITSTSKQEFYDKNPDAEWQGPQNKTRQQGISSVRVINIPIEDFPEENEILDFSVDMNHQNANILFDLMGIPHSKGTNPLTGGAIVAEHGVLKNKDIPKYLRNLMKAKNADLSKYATKTTRSGGDFINREVDKSSNVPKITGQRTARMVDYGISEERIREHIDNLIKMLVKAQKNGLDVQWS